MQKKKKSKQKQTDSLFKKLKDRWILILFVIIVLYIPFTLLRAEIKNYLINLNSEIAKAVIVNEQNYWGNSPVSQTFSYSYEYFVNGKRYRRDSRNEKLKIGDSILIEYTPIYPQFSRIVLKDN